MFEGVGVSLGSFIAGMLFNSIGGSATFRLFGTGALIFLVVHVVIQKVYARFAGSIGKEAAVVRETLPSQRQSQVVYISGNGGSNGPSVEDEKHSMGGGASSILLSEDEAGFREVSLK